MEILSGFAAVSRQAVAFPRQQALSQALERSCALLELNADGVIVSVNRLAAELLGWSPDQLIGRLYDELIPEDPAAQGSAQQFWDAFRTTGYWRGKAERLSADRGVLMCLLDMFPVGDARVVLHFDQGRLAELQTELDGLSKALDLLQSYQPFSVWKYKPGQQSIELDQRLLEWLGGKELGHTSLSAFIETFVAPGSRQPFAETLLQLATSTEPAAQFFEFSLLKGEEEVRYRFGFHTLFTAASPQVHAILAVVVPVPVEHLHTPADTELSPVPQTQASATQVVSRSLMANQFDVLKYQSIVRASLDAIIIANEFGVILDWTGNAESVFGYTADQVLARSLDLLFPPESRDFYRSSSFHPTQECVQYKALHKSGNLFDAEVTVAQWSADGMNYLSLVVRDVTHRVQHTSRLVKSESVLSDAMQLAQLSSWVLDVPTLTLTLDRFHVQLMGLPPTPSGSLALNVLDFAKEYVHPQDVSIIEGQLQDVLTSETPIESRVFNYRLRQQNGQYIYVQVTTRTAYENGKPVQIFGTTQNVDGLKRAEEELQAQAEEIRQNADELAAINDQLKETTDELARKEALLNEALRIARLSTWTLHVPTMQLTKDRFMVAMIGLPPMTDTLDGAMTMSMDDYAQRFVHPDDIPAIQNVLNDFLVNGQTEPRSVIYRLLRTDGQIAYIEVRLRVELDAAGRPIRLYGTNQDITDTKQIEEELQAQAEELQQNADEMAAINDQLKEMNTEIERQKRFYEGIIESLPIPLVIKDLKNNNRVLLMNQKACELFGVPKKDSVGFDLDSLRTPEFQEESRLQNQQLLRERKPLTIPNEYIQESHTGRQIILQTIKSLLFDASGEPTHIVRASVDITEAEYARQAVAQSRQQLQDLTNAVPGMLFQYLYHKETGEGQFTYVSAGAQTLLGLEPEAIVKDQRVFMERISPEDIQSYLDAVQESLRTGERLEWKGQFNRTCGRPIWVSSVAHNQELDEAFQLSTGIVTDITNQVEATLALERSQKRLASAMEIANLATWEADLVNLRFIVNDAFLAITGITLDDLNGSYDNDLFWFVNTFVEPEDAARMAADVEASLRDPDFEPARALDFRARVPRTGQVKYFRNSILQERDPITRKPLRTLGTIQDFTEERLLELENAQKQARLNRQNDALNRLATSEIISNGNLDAALQLITETLTSALQIERSSLWLLDDAYTKITCIDLHEAVENKHSKGIELFAKDFPGYFEAVKTERVIDAHLAVTDPRTKEFAVGYLDVLNIKSMLDVPIRRFGRMIGVICNEKTDEPRTWTTDEIAFATNVADYIALAYESKDRIESYLALQAKEKELQRSLDELKRAQNQLVQSEKMASLGALIASVAHEVNTPISAVKASARNIVRSLPVVLTEVPTLLRNLPEEETQLFLNLVNQSVQSRTELTTQEERDFRAAVKKVLDEYAVDESYELAKELVEVRIVENIEHYIPLFEHELSYQILDKVYKLGQFKKNLDNIDVAAEKTARVVKALKTYSHVQNADHFVQTDIVESLETILTVYANQMKYGVSVEKDFQPGLPYIPVYPDEIGQVWTNIITNAVQAMKGKGKLKLGLRTRDNMLEVEITDSGPGIPQDILPRIFEPFFTTKPQGEGTGLGLDIVKKIVDKHNGKIWVDTEPGRTSFFVHLPLTQ
jgi:PAS domain S-box-containing protein